MHRRRRTILLALLALAVPLPAFALTEGVDTETVPAVSDLSVGASLDSCGLLDTQIVCTLQVSYATLPNATSYTASVTSPDGNVLDFGTVPAGGTSLVVPYVGNGSYGVRITAYGQPEEPGGEEKVIATDVARDLDPGVDDEPRVASPQVESDATGRTAPEPAPETPAEEGPVEAEPTCAEAPPITDVNGNGIPDSEEPPPADPAAASADASAGGERAVAEADVAEEPVEPAAAEEPPAAPACPAP